MRKVWNKICLFFFHVWWGKGAFKFLSAYRFDKGTILKAIKTSIILLNKGRKVADNYEYVVKIVKNETKS